MADNRTGFIKAGTVINITDGCYSDYSLRATLCACKDFNYLEEAKKFYFEFHKNKTKKAYSYDLHDKFFNYLFKNGLAIDCSSQQIHIGDYDFFNETDWARELNLK